MNNSFGEFLTEYINIIFEDDNEVYIVKQGDTLSKIATLYSKYQITVDDIVNINHIVDKNKIRVGQKLIIPINKEQINQKSADSTTQNNQVQSLDSDSADLKELIEKLSKEDKEKVLFIARVLYSETGTKATDEEVLEVATVIYNRPRTKQAFPTAKDIYSAVNDKTQFSCINDKKNSNWWAFKPDLNERTINAVKIAYQLYTNTFEPIDKDKKFSKKYYMYIDHSLQKPPSNFYSKKYWNLVYLPETEHFKFYSLSPKKV